MFDGILCMSLFPVRLDFINNRHVRKAVNRKEGFNSVYSLSGIRHFLGNLESDPSGRGHAACGVESYRRFYPVAAFALFVENTFNCRLRPDRCIPRFIVTRPVLLNLVSVSDFFRRKTRNSYGAIVMTTRRETPRPHAIISPPDSRSGCSSRPGRPFRCNNSGCTE